MATAPATAASRKSLATSCWWTMLTIMELEKANR
jgi:hypothetical protein